MKNFNEYKVRALRPEMKSTLKAMDTQKFINTLYSEKDPLFTVRVFEEPKPRDRKAKSYSHYKTLDDLQERIDIYDASNFGVFFMPNRSNNNKTNDSDIVEAHTVFIDIDNDLLPGFCPLEPSAIISREDEQGHHVYWFIEKSTDLEKWKTAQQELIKFFQSDKVIKNPSRLMRLPGTTRKKEVPHLKYDLKKLNKNRYTLDNIIMSHQDQKHIKKITDIKIKNLFEGEKIHDGEGRHEKMVKAAFILHDYGISGDKLQEKLTWVNDKYFADPYTDTELKTFHNVQKYAKGEQGIKAIDDAMREAEKHERIEKRLLSWYYIYKTNIFTNTNYPDMTRSREGFNAEFSPLTECVNASGYVFRHALVKKAEQQVYEPAKEGVINEGKRTFLNMWKKPTLKPEKGEPKWFIEHINYLFNEEDAIHFISYLAHMIQYPRKKIMHAILIISPHTGTGKSILVLLFKQLFGSTNVVTPHNENITDKYTGWARHCQLCFIHEIMQGDRKEFLNKIKPFITEETIEIREMYQPPYEIKNFMNIIASSNYRLPILLDNDDRRWAILSSEVEAKEDLYYEKLLKNIEENAGQVLTYLQGYSLEKFNPGKRPALNEGKQDLIDMSKSDLEVWIKEGILDEYPPFDRPIINIQDLYDKLPDRHKSRFTTINRLKSILRDCGAVALKSQVRIDKVQKRFWAIRDHKEWQKIDSVGGLKDYLTDWQKDDENELFN